MKLRKIITLLIIAYLLLVFCAPLSMAYPTKHVSFKEAGDEIQIFFQEATETNLILIMGSKVSLIDQAIFDVSKNLIEGFSNEPFYLDAAIHSIDNISEEYIVLLGSEKTNLLTTQIINNNSLNFTETLDTSVFILQFGIEKQTDRHIIILFNKNELNIAQNHAYERSPLSNFLNPITVTIIATAISVILLYLWNMFGSTIIDSVSDYTSESIMERKHSKKKVRRKQITKLKLNEFIDYKELLAIVLSSAVFSFAMSWAWADNYMQMPYFFIMTFIVISIVLFIREYSLQYLCYRYKMRAEHIFWKFGALLTIISSLIGNTFSLSSYTLIDETEGIKKIYGKITFRISLILYFFVLSAFTLNMFYPSIMLQMAYIFTIMMLFIDMLPFSPMDGYDIRKWNRKKWIGFYIVVAITYVLLFFNFTYFF